MSALDAILNQYEKNKQPAGSAQRVSSEERLKKYFAPILTKGVSSGEKRIRIIPMKDGTSPFKEVWFHEIQVDGKWVKLYDPGKNEGKRSPLTEVNEALRSTGNEADRELAKNYNPKRFYIVKVIDRDNEQDGVKFWRFKHNSKGDGPLDKIVPIMRNKGDITDPKNGRDLVISLTLTKKPSGGEYTTISSIFPDDASPISSNEGQATEWLMDDLTWADAYSKKPEEYLEGVAKGYTPKWNSEEKKWVYGDDGQVDLGATETQKLVDPQDTDEVDEDLPF